MDIQMSVAENVAELWFTLLLSEIYQQIDYIGSFSLERNDDFVPTETDKNSGHGLHPLPATLQIQSTRAYRTRKIASTENMYSTYGKIDMYNDFILQPNVHQWEICKKKLWYITMEYYTLFKMNILDLILAIKVCGKYILCIF